MPAARSNIEVPRLIEKSRSHLKIASDPTLLRRALEEELDPAKGNAAGVA